MGTPPPLPRPPQEQPDDDDDLIPLAPLAEPELSVDDDVPLASLAPQRAIPLPNQGQGWQGPVNPQRRRPGLVTAIGVMSIVLGALGALLELISILPVVHIYFGRPDASRTTARVGRSLPPPPQLAPYAGDLTATDGLGRTDSQNVIQ